MDLYEPLGNQQDVVDPPPPTMPKKKAPSPMMPMKGKNVQKNNDLAKPLRDGDDVELMSDSAPGQERRKDTGKKKTSKTPAKSKSRTPKKSSRSSSSKSGGGLVLWQIVVLCVLGLLSVIFIFTAIFGALHLFGILSAIPHLTPLKCP